MSKIKLVKYEFEADKKVFFVDYEFEADEKVLLVEYDFEADYKAFKVKYEFEADLKVFQVKYAFEADEYQNNEETEADSDYAETFESKRDYIRNLSYFRSSSSSTGSDQNESPSSGGCLGRIFKWFIILVIIGAILNYFGLGDETKNEVEITTEAHIGKIINSKGLNLRRAPGTQGDVIKVLMQNDSVWIISDSSQNIQGSSWVLITDKTDTGWVSEKFLN